MARSVITTVQFRAQDLETGDICQLRLHGVNRWVPISAVTELSEDQMNLEYRWITAGRQYAIGRYELVRTQAVKE